MSQAARLHAARSALERVERAAREGGHTALAELASLGLEASGETPSQRKRREDDAERKRTDRGLGADVRTVSAPSVGTARGSPADGMRTSPDTEEGVGGGVSLDLPDLPKSPLQNGGGVGEGPADGVRTSRQVRETDDGASGMSVDAWLAGIQVGTGKPQTRPLPRVCGQLVAAFLTHCPKGQDIVAWAQQKGEEWARTLRAGRSVNAFDFVGWLGAPDGSPSAGPVSTETEAQRNARIDRETEERAEAHRRAQAADKDQDGRARTALARGASTPTRLGVGNG